MVFGWALGILYALALCYSLGCPFYETPLPLVPLSGYSTSGWGDTFGFGVIFYDLLALPPIAWVSGS